MAFMRMYGMQSGGDPGRLQPRRKSAASGPSVKAGRKRIVRHKRAARGGGGGFDFGSLAGAAAGGIPFVGGVAQNLIGQLGHKGAAAAMGGAEHHHRRTNPANVKALRRALRRVEHFGHLVTRVNKMLPRAHHYQVHPVLKHKRKKKA